MTPTLKSSLAILAAFCGATMATSAQPLPNGNGAAKFTPVIVENEKVRAQADIKQRSLALLQSGDFAALDRMAGEMRTGQFAFADGYWHLSLFYKVIADLDPELPEDEWQTHLALLRRWFEEDTQSITARVAMARALVAYAWHARGISVARDVNPNAWQTVADRIAEAGRILEAARRLPEKCPYWYTTWMTAAMLFGGVPERYDEVFTEGVTFFPSYTPIYFMKVWYLQERWHGESGDWQAFAKESADKLGGERGDILYAQIIWFVREMRVYGNPIKESGADWARTRRGFESIRRQYPDSILALSQYCSISGFAPLGAPALVRQLLEEVGNRVDLTVWKKVEAFVRHREWAYEGP